MSFEALVSGLPALAELNKGKGRNRDQFPVLNTEEADPAKFWDSLNWDQKMEVGSVGIHFNMMTANYRWDCGYQDKRRKHTPFKDLSRSQKKIIATALKEKDNPYSMFDLLGMLKLR